MKTLQLLCIVLALHGITRCALGDEGLTLRESRYELDFSLDYETETLAADVLLTVENQGDRPAAELHFLLYRLLTVERIHDPAGKPLEFTQTIVAMEDDPVTQVNHVRVAFTDAVGPGELTTLRIEYSGYLLGYVETGSLYIQDRIDPDFTILRRDALAYPVVGFPSYRKMRAAGLPSFDYLARVTAPAGKTVANGGELVDRSESDGLATTTYRNIQPAWRMDFAIGRYETLEKGLMRVFFFPEDRAGAAGVMAGLESCFALYTDWFGPLQGLAAFAVIEIPDGWGSQADVTSIIQTATSFKDPERRHELYHEVSHLWNVRPLEISPRWNEGLATFLEFLTRDELEGRQEATERLDGFLDQVRTSSNENYTKTPMIGYGEEQITGLSYTVAAVMFGVIYELVGRDEFNQIVGGFYRRYRTSGATTADFIRHANRVTSQDLDVLFEDWIHTTAWYERVSSGASIRDLVRTYADSGS